MAQSNKVCPICNTVGHSKFYCKERPKKPIARTAIKRSERLTKEDFSKESKKVNNKIKAKKESRKGAVKKLDHIYSWYIRIKDSVDGNATCVTCGTIAPWQQLQNGHFYSRARYVTRWDDDNCHVQCMKCNVMLKGNYIHYTKYMIDRYGRDFVDELELKSLVSSKISTITLKEKTQFYKGKVDEMLKIA